MQRWLAKCCGLGKRQARAEFHRRLEGVRGLAALRPAQNGLHGLVTERLGEDPRTGALFVFVNQRRTRLKVLYWTELDFG